MSDSAIVTFALIAAVAGIAYGLYLAMWVFKLSAGNAKMQEISKAIQEGAGAYMNRQYLDPALLGRYPRLEEIPREPANGPERRARPRSARRPGQASRAGAAGCARAAAP